MRKPIQRVQEQCSHCMTAVEGKMNICFSLYETKSIQNEPGVAVEEMHIVHTKSGTAMVHEKINKHVRE